MRLPEGFLASATAAGIKKKGLDVGLIRCPRGASAVGFFTSSANVSYSVTVSKRHIKHRIYALLTSSGNANCFSHEKGIADTGALCGSLAKQLGVEKENILIASTGIIGKKLPFKAIEARYGLLIQGLKTDIGGFAESILTTDTCPKTVCRSLKIKNRPVKVVGCAKGAGMIHPNLATMLAFIFTDAAVDKKTFYAIGKEAVSESFNSITVDGCMSTNDSVVFLASGASSPVVASGDRKSFAQAVAEVCRDLAVMIVKDAEGASKLIRIEVKGAASRAEARKAAMYIAASNLFKTAMYGENPNWGRVVAALGHAGVPLERDRLAIQATSLKKRSISLKVSLGRGVHTAVVHTSDLTPRYVTINAEYS